MNQRVIVSFSILLAGMLACSIPRSVPPTPAVVTQVVVIPNEQVQASPTLPVSVLPIATFTPIPTETVTSTVPSAATITRTTTLSGPVATFVKDANCRQGPGTAYEAVTSFYKGETVQIVGRNPNFNNTWWYVIIPSTGGKC